MTEPAPEPPLDQESPDEPGAAPEPGPEPIAFTWLSGTSFKLGWSLWWRAHLALLPGLVALVALFNSKLDGAAPPPALAQATGILLAAGLVLMPLLFPWAAGRLSRLAFGLELDWSLPLVAGTAPFFLFVTAPTAFAGVVITVWVSQAARGAAVGAGDLPLLAGLAGLFLLGLANGTALISWLAERFGGR